MEANWAGAGFVDMDAAEGVGLVVGGEHKRGSCAGQGVPDGCPIGQNEVGALFECVEPPPFGVKRKIFTGHEVKHGGCIRRICAGNVLCEVGLAVRIKI